MNALAYAEWLCHDPTCANILINSPLAPQLVRAMAAASEPPLRCRLVALLGLMIRYAPVITNDLALAGGQHFACKPYNLTLTHSPCMPRLGRAPRAGGPFPVNNKLLRFRL